MPATTPFGDAEAKPAPGELALVQALINTWDIESGVDLLGDATSAWQWLQDKHLAAVPPTDVATVVAVREALRALVVHNAGGPEPGAAMLQPLRQVMERSAARAVLGAGGEIGLEPLDAGVDGWLLGLVLVVRDTQADGTWARLKACANPDCRWAFYDRSRNHGGTWCEMSGCGNKLKNRDFRARRRAAR